MGFIGRQASSVVAWSQRREAKIRQRDDAGTPRPVRIVIEVAGLALITYSVFMLAVPAGVAVAGVSCFVLSGLIKR